MMRKAELLRRSLHIRRRIEGRLFLGMLIFDARLKRSIPILVYQMGKVASQSARHSIRKAYSGIVLLAHSFSFDHDDWRVRKLYEHAIVNGNPLNIISLTREPIGRNISAFFQNFERDTEVPYKKSDFSLLDLKKLLLENYRHHIVLDWFDNNIKAHFGIDVYTVPFPDCGVATYCNNNVRLLVMRSEIDDDAKLAAIREFIELPGLEMIYKNVGSNKEYAETYWLFKETVQLPSSYVSEMCDSKYFDHFYSKEFVESVRQKWSRNNTSLPVEREHKL